MNASTTLQERIVAPADWRRAEFHADRRTLRTVADRRY